MATRVHPDVARAKADAFAARTRLVATMSQIQARLTPRALLRDAWEEVREQGAKATDEAIATVRERPAATAGLIALTIVFLVREPLFRALMQRFWPEEETAAPPEGSSVSKPKPRRRRTSEESGP